MTRKNSIRLLAVLLAATVLAALMFSAQHAHASCPTCIEVDTYDDSFTVCGDSINLRCAINYANANPGTLIRFNPGIVTVTVQSALPAITGAGTWIDGTDSSGNYVFPTLTGASWSGAVGYALTINASNVTISNIRVVNMGPNAGDIAVMGGKNIEISHDYLGILPGATQCAALPQAWQGVTVQDDMAGSAGSSNGTVYIYADTISCHRGRGIQVFNSNYVYVGTQRDGRTSPGNYIGTTSDGVHAAGNGDAGVLLAGNSDRVYISQNRIAYNGSAGIAAAGTNIDVENNTLSANYWGILLNGDASSDWVQGNNIGTTADGLQPLPNLREGILISWGSGYLIASNLVAYNGGPGVRVTGNSTHADMATNTMYGNGGPPIVLGDFGYTPNDPDDADSGPNTLLNYPVVSGFSGNIVLGTTCPACTVEVFKAIGNPAAPGGGGIFKTYTIADGFGGWSIDLSAYGLTRLDVTFTATDVYGVDSSEMSPRPVLYLPLIRR